MDKSPVQITKKRSVILLFALIMGILILMIIFSTLSGGKSSLPFFAPAPTPITTSTSGINQPTPSSVLSFQQLSPTSIAVVLDSQGKPVSAVQLEIGYDTSVISNVSLAQGNYFSNPIQLANTIDTSNGNLFYALAIPFYGKQPAGKGTIAVITFTTIPGVKDKATFNFLSKTKVTTEGAEISVLKDAKPLSIPIQ